jgi:hypothetical protein
MSPQDRQQSGSWQPDRRTLDWITGILVEDYLYDHMRAQVRSRSAMSGSGFTMPDAPDAFWLATAEAAIETILAEIYEQAEQHS